MARRERAQLQARIRGRRGRWTTVGTLYRAADSEWSTLLLHSPQIFVEVQVRFKRAKP